jgi:DNA-binding MarR family transcriptional regulator
VTAQAPFEPPTSLLFDVFALYQSVGRMLGAYMVDSPLGPAEYAMYSAIFETESISPTALATRLGVPLTTLMDHLARFERRGHISRMADPRDRRASLIVLTASGAAAHAKANVEFQRAYDAFDVALGKSEAEPQLVLRELRAAVDEAARAAPRAQTRSARRRADEAPRPARTAAPLSR